VVSLALTDIQGNILRGYGFPFAAYLFLMVPDERSGRRFLGEIVGEVTHADPWDHPPETTKNVALTYAGLRALGVADNVLCTLPDAFREPIRDRAPRVLDDTGPSAPATWVDGLGSERSHILVMISGSEGNAHPFAHAVATVIERAEGHGLNLVHRQDAAALDNRREHFGWADGFGQPSIEGGIGKSRPGQGVPQDDGITWRDLKAGEFILGYPDEDGQTASGPAASLVRNGTYVVYRRLYQDVARFRREVYEEAARYAATICPESSLDRDQLYELLAAKIVGRWRDGVAIALTGRRTDGESRKLGAKAQDNPDNDFRYWDDDRAGLKCPKGAHIRRTNPRDALGWGGKMSTRHRIIRRGMPYGEYLEGMEDDGRDRGLIFICFNADLERQFEVIQSQWCNDGNAFRLGNDKDYLLGDNKGTGKVTIQGRPPHFAQAQPLVVLTRGCEYLLMPGISALRELAAK
jgi:Dyp-type peroxidase family